ncbi:hypothetical protein HS125_17280 [bacterium]|nr:hypothetical protein [bacterium]
MGTSLTRETPAYLNLLENGELNRRAQTAAAAMREMHRQVETWSSDRTDWRRAASWCGICSCPRASRNRGDSCVPGRQISVHTAVNLMAQYHPNDRLFLYPEPQRRVSRAEVGGPSQPRAAWGCRASFDLIRTAGILPAWWAQSTTMTTWER